MGIVSVVALVAGIAFLISLQRYMNRLADQECDEDVAWWIRWGARASALVALVGALGVVDAYVYDFPSPFEAPEAELPDKAEPALPAERPEIREVAKPDPMGDAREDHGKAMDDFEKRRDP